MESVVLVIHLILALAIIGLVLLQRSEGGGLGIGGGGGLGGLASAQGTANALTRATAIAAGLFFVTSLVLGVLAGADSKQKSILDALDEETPAVVDTIKENLEEAPESITIPPSAPVSE
ncbi:MAG: preprotein translocase subunit SecG [Rhodospirillales bacterium]|nr:preprotein translocase subunit SecG [Rhodospirillales bacterium]